VAVTRTSPRPSARAFAVIAAAGAIAFAAVFRFQRIGRLDFFAAFAVIAALAAAASFAADPGYAGRVAADLRSRPAAKAAAGLVSAAVLYIMFVAGGTVSRLFLPCAAADIARVYALKSGLPAARVALLVGLVIGPAEELFWRGFVQERLAGMTGRTGGWLLAALVYAAVHVPTVNPMLVLAAAVCGLFWGGLYARFRSPLLNVVSHTVWDLLIFVVLPL